jgi:hypothetical protein
MDAFQKNATKMPSEPIERAQQVALPKPCTGPQPAAASRSYERLRQLQAKVRFSRTAADLKADR